MSSKRRIRRRQCQHKKRYPDEESAQNAIRHMRQTGVAYTGLHVYPCDFGNHFHVGRQPKNFRGRLKMWQWNGPS
jgi:hypothetical protein